MGKKEKYTLEEFQTRGIFNPPPLLITSELICQGLAGGQQPTHTTEAMLGGGGGGVGGFLMFPV